MITDLHYTSTGSSALFGSTVVTYLHNTSGAPKKVRVLATRILFAACNFDAAVFSSEDGFPIPANTPEYFTIPDGAYLLFTALPTAEEEPMVETMYWVTEY